jgi:diguanylate cyclase (GGDEF)-like protein/PAS domain S-box-containing protein
MLQLRSEDAAGPGRPGATGALVVLLAIPVAAAAAALGLTRGRLRVDLSNSMQLAAALAAAVVCFWCARRCRGPVRRYRLLLGAGALAWAGGQIYWTTVQSGNAADVPVPSWADAGFLVGYAFLIIAAVATPHHRKWRGQAGRRLLESVAVGAATFSVSWATVLHQVSGRSRLDAAGVVAITYPALDVLLITLLVVGAGRVPRHHRLSPGLAASGLLLLAVSDSFLAWKQSHGGYATGGVADLGWIAGWALVAASSAVVRDREEQPSEQVGAPSPWMSALAPAALVAMVGAGIVERINGHPLATNPVLATVGLVAFAATAAALVVAERDARTWARRYYEQARRSVTELGRYEGALAAAGSGTWEFDVRTARTVWSPALEQVLGLEAKGVGLTIDQVLATVHPEDRERAANAFGEAIQSGRAFSCRYRVRREDGSEMWVHTRGRARVDGSGRVIAMSGITSDINALRAAEIAGEVRRRHGEAVTAISRGAVTLQGIGDFCGFAVKVVAETLEVDAAYVIHRARDADKPVCVAAWGSTSEGVRGPLEGDKLMEQHTVEAGVTVPIGASPRRWGMLAVESLTMRHFSADDTSFLTAVANTVSSVVQRRRAERELEVRALKDELTGLPNRVLLRDRLQILLSEARHSSRVAVVIHVGIDRFTRINESFGWDVGDEALSEIGERLKAVAKATDTVARYGGDEFVLAAMVDRPDDAVTVAQEVLADLSQPFLLGDPAEDVFLAASLGVAVSNGTSTVDELLLHAASALAGAVAKGGRRYELHDADLRNRSADRIRAERMLRRAIDDGQLEPWYQPLVRVTDGTVVGAEALIRWNHPERGWVGPGEFLAVAHESGLIHAMGEQVMNKALKDAARWIPHIGRVPDFELAVNLSSTQLQNETLAASVRSALEESGWPVARLCLEVVEDSIRDDTAAIRVLHQLHEIGPLKVVIDDFGTGHSSLARLRRLPIEGFKIDRSFVSDLACDALDRSVAAAILNLGDSLGVRVVAEGVESSAQLEVLRELGCTLVQGWYFAAAMPADAFADLLAAGPYQYRHIVPEESAVGEPGVIGAARSAIQLGALRPAG